MIELPHTICNIYETSQRDAPERQIIPSGSDGLHGMHENEGFKNSNWTLA